MAYGLSKLQKLATGAAKKAKAARKASKKKAAKKVGKAAKRSGYRRDFDPYEVKDTDPKYLQKATLQQRKDWHKQKMSPAQAEALKKGTEYPPSALKGGGPAYGKWWSEMKKVGKAQERFRKLPPAEQRLRLEGPAAKRPVRGKSAIDLAGNYDVKELKAMIKGVRSGKLSDKEKASQIKRLNKAIDRKKPKAPEPSSKTSPRKARAEADLKQIMDEGQRQWRPEEGMVMKRGGLIGPSYRHGHKDYRKGGLAKRIK